MNTLLEAYKNGEVAEYISEKYSKSLEFYAERIADSDNDDTTIAEQVDGALGMILDTEDSEWGHKSDYSQEVVEALTDVVYDMVVYGDEDGEDNE